MSRSDGGLFVEHLAERECMELLASAHVGRIGVIVDSAPEIYPINFALTDRAVLFRTDDGNKLRGLERSPSVCFEIDDIDREHHTGWSVLIKGRASELLDEADIDHARSLRLDLWSIGMKSHWFVIHPREVTGRRIAHVQ